MDIKEFIKLIEKYKKGECSPQEKELLGTFLESFQDNSGMWIENEMGDQRILEEKIYSKILNNINKEKNNDVNKIFFSPAFFKIAASVTIFLTLCLGILYISGIFPLKASLTEWNKKVTLSGEKSIINLSDGSIVTLNADSKLKYPDIFDDTKREVYLEGEAYFVIRHNTNQPFIVHTEDIVTTVMGTKFDISAYPENNTIAVSLLEGKVKVSRIEKGNIHKNVVLKPKEKLLYDKENNVSLLGLFDSLEAIGWKDNIYKFNNVDLGSVLLQLEKAYGVKFRLTSQSVLAQKITVKFERNSLQTIVDVIKSLTGLDYKIIKRENGTKEILFTETLNNISLHHK